MGCTPDADGIHSNGHGVTCCTGVILVGDGDIICVVGPLDGAWAMGFEGLEEVFIDGVWHWELTIP